MFFFGKKSDIEINRLVEKFTRFQAGLFYSIDGSNVKFYSIVCCPYIQNKKI